MPSPRKIHEDNHLRNLSLTQSISSDESASSTISKRRSKRRSKRKSKNNNQIQNQHPQQSNLHAFLKPHSKKVHDAPMKRRDMYFALDCEMVGIGQDGLESALARVSLVNFENQVVLDTYVKVDEGVTDYRTFVSGIEPKHIRSNSAMPLQKVQRLVSNILNGKILVGHGLENDLKVMGIHHPWCDIRDTAKFAPFMRKIQKENEETIICPRRLRDLVMEKFGKEIQVMGKAHSPIEDAIAAMDLYKAVRHEWEMHIQSEVNKAQRAQTQGPPQTPSQNQVLDLREPIEPLRPIQTGIRVSPQHHRPIYYQNSPPFADHGNQYLYPSVNPPSPLDLQKQVHQFVPPVKPLSQNHLQSYKTGSNSLNNRIEYNQNAPSHIPRRSKVVEARRAKELAKAKVVAAMHHQRLAWQKQMTEKRVSKQPVHISY